MERILALGNLQSVTRTDTGKLIHINAAIAAGILEIKHEAQVLRLPVQSVFRVPRVFIPHGGPFLNAYLKNKFVLR